MKAQIIAVRKYCEHKIHIVDTQDRTLCGEKIGRISMNYSKVPADRKVCKKCLAVVGDVMLSEYVGGDNIE